MTFNNLFSLSYPTDAAEQEIFRLRVNRFFTYTVANMLSLIFGAGLIALVLYVHGAEIKLIMPLFIFTSTIATIILFISKHVLKNNLCSQKMAFFLILRITLGCLIAVLYATAVLLLPEPKIDIGILLLLTIYLVSIAVAVFQYSAIPTYYIAYNISIFFPLTIFLLITPNNISTITIILLVSGTILFIGKGLKVSISEINSLKINQKLQAEISEHIITRKELRKMALYDNLTKVPNRYLFENNATSSILKAEKNGQQLALLFVDLNNFKYINDHFGHGIGDKILIETAKRIKRNIRSTDLVARLGGDEFVVCLEDFFSDKINYDLITSIQSSLNENVEIDGNSIKLSACIGTAIYPRDGENLVDLLRYADKKMYQQKHTMKSS